MKKDLLKISHIKQMKNIWKIEKMNKSREINVNLGMRDVIGKSEYWKINNIKKF